MAKRNLLPEMISVSRNCGFTLELHKILTEKLADSELEVLHRWLQIIEEERDMEIKSAKRHIRGF